MGAHVVDDSHILVQLRDLGQNLGRFEPLAGLNRIDGLQGKSLFYCRNRGQRVVSKQLFKQLGKDRFRLGVGRKLNTEQAFRIARGTGEVKPLEQQEDTADDSGRNQRQRVEPGAGAHSAGYPQKQKPHISGLFHRVPKADDRHGADQRKRSSDVGADHDHNHRGDKGDQDQGVDEALTVAWCAMRGAVGDTDAQATDEGHPDGKDGLPQR